MPPEESIRVHGKLYTSPAFLEAHQEIQALAEEPGCSLPRILIGLMFGSDATQLTAFGGASLWPCYMYFGNESKYRRCKPTCNLCNHIAYFCKVRYDLYFLQSILLSYLVLYRYRPSFKISQHRTRIEKALTMPLWPTAKGNFFMRNGKSCSMMISWRLMSMV